MAEVDEHCEFFVVGTGAARTPVVCKLTSTDRGWKQRGIHGDARKDYNVDYESGEDLPELVEWFQSDFRRAYRMYSSEEEALTAYNRICCPPSRPSDAEDAEPQ